MNPGLLTTKLHRPSMPPARVHRPHLSQRLNDGLASGRRMTLVSAPAGFGKTTCVGEWVGGLDRQPVAWLSLDAADDDPRRFFAYLIAALQQVDEDLGLEIEGALHSGQLPPAAVISTGLINDVVRVRGMEGRFLLILDDFHVIQDGFILQVLEQLLANLPPTMHLVLLTREDPPLPLARLRANNQLTEIRAADLRFGGRDTEQFLNAVLGLSLPPDQIVLLEAKTEGWVAGLQLAGLSIRNRADPAGLIAALSGSHRFILSYLTEEVLNRQPKEVQRFLLETSILDRLNGDLCDAVTGRSGGPATLERLFNANLFLIPLDDEGQWYRYHHLFADLLRSQQAARSEGETAELHRRAAGWYARASSKGEPFASEAIQHALAAEDYAMAVDLLERHASGMIRQGYAKTVNGWVQAIPEDWRASSPRTSLAFAWMHLLRGVYVEAAPHLERAQSAFADPQAQPHLGEEGASLRAEWLVMQSLLQNMQGKPAEALALATEALEIAPEQDSHVRGLAYFGLAGVHEVMEDDKAAVDAYEMAIRCGRAAKDLATEMLSTVGLAKLAFEHGQLHLACEIAAPVTTRLEGEGAPPPISTVIFGILAEIYYHWCQVDEGKRHARRALQLSTLGGYNSGLIGLWTLLSRLSQLEGDLDDAAREIQRAIERMQVDTPDYIRQEAISQQARLYLAQNRPAAAQMALQGQGFSFRDRFSFPALSPGQSISHSMGLLYDSGLYVLLHKARAGGDLASLQSGIELASGVIARALQGQHLLVALEALLLRGQMHALLGESQAGSAGERAAHLAASQADYIHALELGEPEGLVGGFLEQGPPLAQALASLLERNRLGRARASYVERILAAFSRAQPPATTHGRQPAGLEVGRERPAPIASATTIEAAPLVEALTDREREVLCLMARGLKYREIAAELFISLNTVRSHVKAIYGKLMVNNRTRAVEEARRLGIL